jgi:outer membrane protein OmpA-like peptidoglycan-associated protein/tetratricopeptide (TPR) repeat protein
MIRFLLLAFLFPSSLLLSAQDKKLGTDSDKARKLYEESGMMLTARKFDQAIAHLQKALDKDPNFAEAHFRLARTYDVLRQEPDAIRHYEKTLSLKPALPSFVDANMTVGKYYLSRGEYEKAKTYFQRYVDQKPAKPTHLDAATKGVATCDYAQSAVKNPLSYQSKPLSKTVNAFALQYFPVLTVDQQMLIFTARNLTGQNNDENIYVSYRKGAEWSAPEPISTQINTAENEGTCSITADGRTLVFTSCQGRQSFGSCDLFVSYRIGNEWVEPINMGPKINSYSWESQPSLSADGRTLYFVSDRRGGYGRRDIWMSKLGEDGQWGTPTNLGPTINTPDDDLSPFVHANGTTLFFSSQGHLGLGGYDLFFSDIKSGKWSKPENLGYPINTHEDQVSLFVTADGQRAYYSLEKGEGERRISSVLHEFVIPGPLVKKYNRSDYLKGKVYDARTKQPLNAKIEVFNIVSNQLASTVQSDRKSGEYVSVLTEGAEYALYINKDGYLFKSLSFDFSQKKEYEPLVLDIYLEPIRKGATEILKNIFFKTAKYELELKSQTELDKIVSFLNGNKDLTLEISGHTDDVGKDEDNLVLSKKRAQALFDYLIRAGIPRPRIRFQGYGETKPAVPNTSEENRQLNRRIELKVL